VADRASPFTGLGARLQDAGVPQQPVEGSTTARLRAALRDEGPLSAAALQARGGLASTALVGALLKHDIGAGRVRFRDSCYELVPDEEQQAAGGEVLQAIALLERHGYTVRKPVHLAREQRSI
jgi:predicted HD phosphohydrolase